MTRVAAYDCGTNSIRLLVADVPAEGGPLVDLDRRMEVVRLGEGVDRTGLLSAAALERTFAAARGFAEVVRDLGAERVRFVATSASRDAGNRDAFVAGIADITGATPEVVTGAEEAGLSFLGATGELVGEPGPHLVVDIGGGSTEVVLGDGDRVLSSVSVDVGCVRLTERHLHGDPPGPDEVAAARADVEAALDRVAAAVDLAAARTLVGLAGSVTTVAALVLGLTSYDPAAIHHARLPALHVRAAAVQLLAMTRSERAALAFMHPGRVDVIGAGALVLAAVVERIGLPEVLVSEHDILDGIALSLVHRTD